MTKNTSSPDELISLIIKGMEDIKGENIALLDLRNIENTVCDYFIIFPKIQYLYDSLHFRFVGTE